MSRGFTIIELMIVVVLVAILASLAAPGMRSLIVGADVRGASSDFYAALLTARSEAIKRRANATVAPIGATWATGWTVTVGGSTFQKTDALSSRVAVQVPSTTAVVYAMNGRIASGDQTVIFYGADDATIQPRCVAVDINGLPRVRTDNNRDPTDGCN